MVIAELMQYTRKEDLVQGQRYLQVVERLDETQSDDFGDSDFNWIAIPWLL
jgi:hypothetical protein